MSMTEQQVAVVSGASAGIGKATARMLVAQGWHVIGTGRDPERTAAAQDEIKAAAAQGGRIDFARGDFCEMKEVKRVADEIAGLTDRIDVLINNAGGVRDRLHVSSEGVEAMLAANHLAPFLLTRELMPLLEATVAVTSSGTVRVIAVSSLAHHLCKGLQWGDLNLFDDFTTNAAYCQVKLANLLFTRELARRVADKGIVAQAMHPGRVESNFASHGDQGIQDYFAVNESDPPERPAQTLVWLATATEGGERPGRYFFDKAEAQAGPQALDDKAAARLWVESERMLEKIGV